jgi:hypothetical protein
MKIDTRVTQVSYTPTFYGFIHSSQINLEVPQQQDPNSFEEVSQ